MRSNWKNIAARRELLRELVTSELRSDSAATVLGSLWWLLDPLLMMLTYWLVFSLLLGRGRPAYEPYPVFILCALVTWKHIANCIGRSTRVVRGREGLIKAVPFPTMLLPLAVALSGFIYFAFGLAICFAASLIWRNEAYSGSAVALIQLAPLMLLQTLIASGLSLIFAALGVVVRDLNALIAHVLRIGFYLSPGLYGVDLVHESILRKFGNEVGFWLYELYMLNPAAMLIDGYRHALLYGTMAPAQYWVVLAIEAAVLLWAGNKLYQHYDSRIVKFL